MFSPVLRYEISPTWACLLSGMTGTSPHPQPQPGTRHASMLAMELGQANVGLFVGTCSRRRDTPLST